MILYLLQEVFIEFFYLPDDDTDIYKTFLHNTKILEVYMYIYIYI